MTARLCFQVSFTAAMTDRDRGNMNANMRGGLRDDLSYVGFDGCFYPSARVPCANGHSGCLLVRHAPRTSQPPVQPAGIWHAVSTDVGRKKRSNSLCTGRTVSTTHAAAVERLDLCDTEFRFGIRTTAYQVLGTQGREIIPLYLNEYISSECRLYCRPSFSASLPRHLINHIVSP
jgi:hypothetical protein